MFILNFLVTSYYSGTQKNIIWKFNLNTKKLTKFSEQNYIYEKLSRKSNMHFGIDIKDNLIYTFGSNVLTIFNKAGDIVKQKSYDILEDGHDLKIMDDKIYCTSTGNDSLCVFNLDLELEKQIDLRNLKIFEKVDLVRKNQVFNDGLHANFLSQNPKTGKIYITHSFTIKRNKFQAMVLKILSLINKKIFSFKNRNKVNKAQLLDYSKGKVKEGGGVFEISTGYKLQDLYGLHDGLFKFNNFYVNETHNIRTLVYSNTFDLISSIEYDTGSIVRGLYPIEPERMLVGHTKIDSDRSLSSIYANVLRNRDSNIVDQHSSLKIVRSNGEIESVVPFDDYKEKSPEIFKIIPYN